jgi:PKD repeat protein
MESLATVPPSTEWPSTFTAPNNVNYTVRMTNSPTDYPVGCTTTACLTHTPIFQYGPTAGPFVTIDPTAAGNTNPSNFTTDGTITIVVPRSGIGNPQPGQSISGFLTRIAFNGGVATVTPDNMPDNLAPAGSYTLVGNLPCNTAPVAALSANPLSGDAPLLVNFDASASTDPDAGDTIASFTFDFGDGSAPVTQSGATISHTYISNGHYHATVSVTDSHGLASSNTAGVEIEVEVPLADVVSRKVHGNTDPTPRDIDLMPAPEGTVGVECRNKGDNIHTMIFTFDRNLVTTPAPTVRISQGTANVASSNFGPAANQYTVNLSGVADAQHLQVSLDGLHDTAGAILNDVPGRMDVLLGDTNGDGVVNAGDTIQVRNHSGETLGTTNFRYDVNVDGLINAGDTTIVRSRSGDSLP